ncbi:MAG TPA: hypothetical protein VLZ83_16160 [Edaphocola sp.]|nr:hypothetical protein [Edaphocola sp.]
MNRNFKKIGLIIAGIVVLLMAITAGINWWIDSKLPKIILEKNETPYQIQYKELKISLVSKTINATGITIIPKVQEKDSLAKNGIYAAVGKIQIDNFSIYHLLFTNQIKAHTITVTKPIITLFKDSDITINSTKNISSQVVAPFQKIIKVANINLEEGNLFIVNIKNNKTLFSANNVTIQLEDIKISDQTLEQKIPFVYKKYAFNCDSLFYFTDDGYKLSTDKIATTNTGMEVNNFAMVSKFNRVQFVKQLAKEKDLYTLKVDKIAIKNMDWGFKEEVLFFKTNEIVIDQADANIYRNKLPEDDLSIKPLYNKLLRELPFELKVDTLSIINSNMVYEEEKSFDKGAGKIEFSSFNLKATQINSGFQKKKLPDVVIVIDCKFMKRSAMHVDWRFNVLDKSDGFKIKGRILNFETGKLAVFTKPYLNATTEGILDQTYFNLSGNDNIAVGDFALKYHDFKVTFYRKKDREKKSKLKSWIGNLLISDDSDGELVEHEVSVERIKEKSFFNFFWRCIAEGLKKTLI